MIEKKGPYFPKTIETESDLNKLIIPDPYEGLGYTLEAIKITKKELAGKVPIIGFAGAPWTIFSYMIEGGGSKTFSKAKKNALYQPSTFSSASRNDYQNHH
jgi:uroporphyrinogen decarboxylase